MRQLELGRPASERARLTALIRSGAKVATCGPVGAFPTPPRTGERFALDAGGTVEVIEVRRVRLGQVGWAMVEAEGEGERSIAQWRRARSADWRGLGYGATDEDDLLWLRFGLVDPVPMVHRATAGDLGLPEGYRHRYAGKVRELFDTPAGDLLFVASDRISAFDWVLPTPIPDKGKILTAMSLWWFEQVADIVGDHVVSLDVPQAVQGRAMLCRPLDMFGVECVVRGYLTGSGLADYRASGSVCGVPLPSGLVDGSPLPDPIFTPATKADVGEHDQNIDFATVERLIGPADADRLRVLSVSVYARAAAVAAERGIIVADTKFEFGRDPASGSILLADEVLTPDSSRFWPVESWSPGRAQPSFDKQFVRDWLSSPASGWNRAGDQPPPPLPGAVVEGTRERYREAFRRLTGREFRG